MSQSNPSTKEANILAAEYIIHGSQIDAFKATYPNSKASEKSKHEKASVLFKSIKVQSRIEELKILSKKNSDKEFTMSISELKKVLTKAMREGLNQGKIAAAVSAVREFNCMDGNHSPIKTEDVTGKGSITPWESISASEDG